MPKAKQVTMTSASNLIPSINDDLQDIAQIAHQVGGEGFEDMQPHKLEELIVTHRGIDRRGSRRAHQ
jgi:hypothetical protein